MTDEHAHTDELMRNEEKIEQHVTWNSRQLEDEEDLAE